MRLLWEQEAAGSNPLAPITMHKAALKRAALLALWGFSRCISSIRWKIVREDKVAGITLRLRTMRALVRSLQSAWVVHRCPGGGPSGIAAAHLSAIASPSLVQATGRHIRAF